MADQPSGGSRKPKKKCSLSEKEKIRRAKRREYYYANQETILANQRDRYANLTPQQKEEVRLKAQQYYLANKDRFIKKNAKYWKKNKKKLTKKQKAYKEANILLVRQRANKRRREKPILNVISSIKNGINAVITGRAKTSKYFYLLGCTKEEFIKHIESKWKPGMNWKNYGSKGWVFDHRKPLASFPDLTDPEQQKACFNFRNVQPLFAADNISKNSLLNGVRHYYIKPISDNNFIHGRQ